jgi:NAD(P)-dependent dehydrogenase (short-subunit alcohol dehydrogenase family)
MAGRLHGKRCLIVGGTSGIGLATAKQFREENARVVIAGLADDHLPTARKEIPDTTVIPCDCQHSLDAHRLFADAVESLGGLDVLYHVAGCSGRRWGDGSLHECSEAGWLATLQANLTSVFLTNQAAVKHFLGTRQPGAILNMSSVLALSPAPVHFDTIAYTAAKGGIISMSRLAAARYAAHGIRVNVIAPGLIDTPMSQRAVSDPVMNSYLQSKQPLADGPGSVADCAAAAVFLCSDEARLITGVVLPVDGGWCVSPG